MTGGAALYAWIPFTLPGQKHWITRGLMVLAVIFGTAVFGRNLLDVFWLGCHAGDFTH